MIKNIRMIRTTTVFLSLMLCAFSFQNCTHQNFHGDAQNTPFNSASNGDSYPGKPGYYLQDDPNNPCHQLSKLGNPFPKNEIFLSGGKYSLVRENCRDIEPVMIDPSQITVNPDDTIAFNGSTYNPRADLSEYDKTAPACKSGQSINMALGNLYANPLDLSAPVWQTHPEFPAALSGSISALPRHLVGFNNPAYLDDWERVSQYPVMSNGKDYVVSFLIEKGSVGYASIQYAGRNDQFVVVIDLNAGTSYTEWTKGNPNVSSSVKPYDAGYVLSVYFTSDASGPNGDIGVSAYKPTPDNRMSVGDYIYAAAASLYECN